MKNLLKLLAGVIGLGLYSITLAGTIDHFDITTTPSSVKIGETVDITVKALDKDGAVVKDYVGEVLIFSQSDPKAEFPGVLTENTYTFQTSDAGVVKFENAVKFTQKGTQDINVYDISNEDVFGYAEVEVGEGATTTSSGEITISYPEAGITLGNDKLKVSGKTLKNYKVKILLNKDKVTEGISNGEGVFGIEIKDIPSGENSLKAQLIDADGKVIGESSDVLFKIESSAPKFKTIKLTPSEKEVAPETVINVELEATNGLTSVELILNDVVFKLAETSKTGVYTGSVTAPKEEGEYKMNLTMKNELGIEAKENGVSAIIVKIPELNAATLTETGTIEVNCDDFKKELEIKNIKSVKLKSKSVISWDKVDKASSYNVYKKDKSGTGMTLIENVTDNKYEIVIQGDVVEYDDFAVKAVFKDDVCDVESENYSDMTKVQTGPKEMLFVILLLSLTIGIFVLRRKNA